MNLTKLKFRFSSPLTFVVLLLSLSLLVMVPLGCAGGAGRGDSANEQTATPTPVAPRLDGRRVPLTEPITISEEAIKSLSPKEQFFLGAEIAWLSDYRPFRYKRVGLITNQTALDQKGRHTIERLASNQKITLARVFLIQETEPVKTTALDEALELVPAGRVTVLTAESYRPSKEDLHDLDFVVFDVALGGSRTGLDMRVLNASLEEASFSEKQFFVFDRPLIDDSRYTMAPVVEEGFANSELCYLPIPLYPAMTAGELAKLFNTTYGIQASLTVVEMKNWFRSQGNRWIEQVDEGQLDEKGKANLAELQADPGFQPGLLRMRTAGVLAGEELWSFKELPGERKGNADLLVVPTQVDLLTLAERMQGMAPLGVDVQVTSGTLSQEGTALALRLNGEDALNPVELSLQLRFAGVPRARTYPHPDDGGPYGSRDIFRLFRRGRTPDQITRRVENSLDLQAFQELSKKVLLYEP